MKLATLTEGTATRIGLAVEDGIVDLRRAGADLPRDTAQSPSPFAMAALKELVDPSHILFGSDYPFAPGIVANMEVQALDQLKVFDATTKAGIDRGHALNLFPKYKD